MKHCNKYGVRFWTDCSPACDSEQQHVRGKRRLTGAVATLTKFGISKKVGRGTLRVNQRVFDGFIGAANKM